MVTFLLRRWYIILIILIIAGAVYYFRTSASTQGKKDTTYTMKRESIEDILSVSGNIDADEKTTVRFQSAGRLSWVGVKEGDYVQKYQGIASLDQRDIQIRMRKFLDTYMKARIDLDQEKSDTREVVIGGLTKDQRERVLREVDQVQLDLNNSVADVQLQSLAAEYAYLTSPIEGLVVRVTAPYAGVNIIPAQGEFDIVNPNTIYFSAVADQTDIAKIFSGMKADIILDSYPDDAIYGTVGSISFTPEADEAGTMYEVKIQIQADNASYKYRLGMTGDASFVLDRKENVLAVPNRYIKTEEEKKYVFVLRNKNKEQTFIETGEGIDSKTIVLSGLKEGDIVTE